MKIKNFEELAVTDARRALLTIAEAGLMAIDTEAVLRKMIRIEGDTLVVANQTIKLADIGKLVFVAIGKCAVEAGMVAEDVLGDRISRGVAVDVKAGPAFKHLKAFCGTHPLPSEENFSAATAIVESLEGLTERDLVIFMISGGGSTLLFLPEDKGNREEGKIFQSLTASGATIQEINTVRKHLSYARGGYLAKDAHPARVVSLIFSDIPGNELSFIASGPTVKDETTIEAAEGVLAKFDVLRTCDVERCGIIETPKENKYFDRVSNVLVVANTLALEAMKKKAEDIGYSAQVKDTELTGEAADVAKMVGEAISAAVPKSVILWGGETTVTIKGNGTGGRNLTVCATALRNIKEGEEILSLASDGRDHGPFAGALCDTVTKKTIADAGLDLERALADNDTYPLFEKAGNYLMTGDTGSNVSDLIIALKKD
jgi:glycerate-2-kinase